MRFLIAAAARLAQAAYGVIKLVAPVRHKVVILSRQSDSPSRDLRALADALRTRDPGLEVVVRCRMVGDTPGALVVSALSMLGQMYHLATARVCVVDGHVIPVSLLRHRPGLFVIQMWHALGAIKKFGYQSLDRPGGRTSELARALRMHRNYDIVLCSGEGTVPVFAEAFDVDAAIVRPLGLPRIDYLLQHADDARAEPVPEPVAAVRTRFPMLSDEGRTTVLYAPTFRKGANAGYDEVIAAFAGDAFALMVKPHPLESLHFDGPNVADVGDRDALELLPLCDAVVTDYSAIAFEALVIDVPVYFFVHDIDTYRHECGLNIDPLAEFPEIASQDIGEIARWIGSGRPVSASEGMLKRRYVSAAGGGCTDRIVDVVMAHASAGAR